MKRILSMLRVAALVSTALSMTPAAQAGALKGTIVFEGKAPRMRPIPMDADPICAKIHGGAIVLTDWLVLGEGQTVANMLVHVTKGVPKRDYPVPDEPFALNQTGCVYTPHVFGLRAGQTLRILNPDGTLHNVHPMPVANREFNKSMPGQRKEMNHVFKEPEAVFPIKCDVHPWMKSYCAVFDHPFFDVSSTKGTFLIEGLEPGEYEIEAWHERLGVQRKTVTIPPDGDATIDFTFYRPKPAQR